MKANKRQFRSQIFIWVLPILLLTSCSDYGPDFSGFGDTSVGGFGIEECVPIACEIEDVIISETWFIASFINFQIDKTSNFEDYIFSTNGLFINAFNTHDNTTNYLGSWRTSWEADREDYLLEDIVLILTFNFSNAFTDLNGPWDFMSFSESSIELCRTNALTGEKDYLTFERVDE